MKRIFVLFALLLSLFLLTSCSDNDFKSLYKDSEYERVVEITNNLLSENITEASLYYNFIANYRLSNMLEATKSAELYYYLFDNNKSHRILVLRMMLFNSLPEIAYEAGKELMSLTDFSKNDNIQYYKVLNDNELFTAASKHLSEISSSLTAGEIAYAVINGNAPTWQIISSLDNLYKVEGVSKDFVRAIKLALPIVVERDGIDYISILLKDTYDGSADYSIVLGDFYYAIGESELALNYWSNAAPKDPKEIHNREKLLLR